MHLLAGAEPRHHLVILQPESAVRRVALPQGSLTIGRALPSTLLLEAAEVSRAHCRIDVAGDDVTVTDLNSTNGTFVDNKRLAGTAPLPHGALLRIGNYVLTCEYESVLQAQEADSTRRASLRRSDGAAAAPYPVVVGTKPKTPGKSPDKISEESQTRLGGFLAKFPRQLAGHPGC